MALCQFLKWLLQVLRVVSRNQFVSSKKTKASSGYERCHNCRDLVKYATNPSIPLARLFYSVDCVGSYFSVAGTLSSTALRIYLEIITKTSSGLVWTYLDPFAVPKYMCFEIHELNLCNNFTMFAEAVRVLSKGSLWLVFFCRHCLFPLVQMDGAIPCLNRLSTIWVPI